MKLTIDDSIIWPSPRELDFGNLINDRKFYFRFEDIPFEGEWIEDFRRNVYDQ